MELLDRHRASVAPVLAFDTDIIADKAEGLWVYDKDGNRWADFVCGTAVTNLGHHDSRNWRIHHRRWEMSAGWG